MNGKREQHMADQDEEPGAAKVAKLAVEQDQAPARWQDPAPQPARPAAPRVRACSGSGCAPEHSRRHAEEQA